MILSPKQGIIFIFIFLPNVKINFLLSEVDTNKKLLIHLERQKLEEEIQNINKIKFIIMIQIFYNTKGVFGRNLK